VSLLLHETRHSTSFTPAPAGVLRRKCACGGGGSAECEGCRKKGTLQRTALDDAEIGAVPGAVHETLRSAGRPLDPATRTFMEARLGHDFSRVRVHGDARAGESARQIHASAYSLGQHVVFAGGLPSIASAGGRRLLAHELAHTVQQDGADAPGMALRIGSPHDAQEHEADAAARAVDSWAAAPGASRPAAGREGSAAAVRRQPEDNPRQPKDDPRPEPFEPTGAPTVDVPGQGEMEIDPVVIAPDVDGVPDFLRGKEVKLSDLKKALDKALGKDKKQSKGAPPGFCEGFRMERGEFPPVEGLCCPKFKRDPKVCCKSTNIDTFEARCCRPNEVPIHGKCFTPKPAPPLPPTKVPKPQPKPKPDPTPAPAPVPVSTTVFFEFNEPGTAAKDEASLRKSLTSEGSKNFDLLVKELKDNPAFKVQLAGRASSEGPAWYNVGLAGRRARLVADVLVSLGIDRSRITEPADGGSGCKKVEDGIHNCGEAGAAEKTDPNDRQVRAQVFAGP
jgi:hypothetical protein